jgi:hypothetical protein
MAIHVRIVQAPKIAAAAHPTCIQKSCGDQIQHASAELLNKLTQEQIQIAARLPEICKESVEIA